MSYNGIKPHLVVVLDNCAIHHFAEVVKFIQEVGAEIIFLPPYSPDLNPIEELFSKVKTTLKSAENLVHTTDLETLLLHSFTTVTEKDCKTWIHHSYIDNNLLFVYYTHSQNVMSNFILVNISFCSVNSLSLRMPPSNNCCKYRNSLSATRQLLLVIYRKIGSITSI